MIRQTDISVVFNPNTLPNSRSLGYGQIDILGIILAYTVYPSAYGLGFMVSYASKPVIKDGRQVLDEQNKPKYFKEVYIRDVALRNNIDLAVQNAMANKGVYVGATAQAAQQAGLPMQQPPAFSQPQSTSSSGTTFSLPPRYQAPPVDTQPVQQSFNSSSIVLDDDLPF